MAVLKTLKDFQREVAIKYGLGESLVMGHRKAYFDEATLEFTKYHVQEALKAAEGNVTILHKNYKGSHKIKFPYSVDDYSDLHLDVDSITNAYPLTNIK